ncbi:MAG: V-type ATP synthase subunit E [bacterium]
MGKAELLSKIKLEFESGANKIVEETDLNICQMEKENAEKISAKRHEIFTDLDRNIADVHRKDMTEADIKIRSLLLEMKQGLIDDVFKEVQAKIKGSNYHRLIENMLMSSVQNGEGEVVFAKEDNKSFTEDFIKGINGKIKALGKNSRFILSQKYGNFSGGFILRYSGIAINNTFETIFGHLRTDLEMEVGKILFS